MPYIVNGQPVPEELIRQEEERIARDARWKSIQDKFERVRQLRAAAVQTATDRVLVEQAAASDPRPIDPEIIEQEAKRMVTRGNCRSGFDDSALRQVVEKHLRLQRTTQEMVSGAAKPTLEQIDGFYQANRENFRNPDLFRAAHIVKHVNEAQTEEQALAGIQVALAELERGEPFSEVADRHSDCKGNGGDLGQFPSGHMVPEFENAIRALEPGQRTGSFTTPFGFHIARLDAKIPGGQATFDEVREDIQRVFIRMNEHQAYLRGVAELRSHADIRWVPPAPDPS